jgi:hypothetical protein
MNCNAPGSFVEDDEPCKDGPDCKFDSKRNARDKVNPKAAKPEAKKGKKAAPQASRLFNRPSPAKGKEEEPPSPLMGSEEEGLMGSEEEEEPSSTKSWPQPEVKERSRKRWNPSR